MLSWLADNNGAIDSLTKIVATLFAVLGGGWGLYQYFKGSQLRAAENLLRMEEEFRNVLGTYTQIEDPSSYERIVKPVLQAEKAGTLDDGGLKKLTELDRCLRFLYVCSVMNDALHIDKAFGVPGGALQRAYYHYMAILLPEGRQQRPELLAYTDREYRRLTAWIAAHASELRNLSPTKSA